MDATITGSAKDGIVRFAVDLKEERPRKVGESPRKVGERPRKVGESPSKVGESPRKVGESPWKVGNKKIPQILRYLQY